MSLFFTKRKFQTYSKESQHKKASELLKSLYLELLYQKSIPTDDFENYKSLCSWMELDDVAPSLEKISERYHLHIKEACINLNEHEFLPKVEHLDKSVADRFLDIDIYLDNIRSSFNIGSIMRTTEALRLGRLIFASEMARPDHKKVLDTAMGTDRFQTPQVDANFIPTKTPVIAIETAENATPLYDFTFPENFTLIFGNEEYGISEKYLKKADHIVKIPLHGIKNSLNVATAFSIVGYEIRRQLRANA
ncbi:MAG: tRNA (guanosine(18)-2'-O)-methyltransferase [Chlamydiia bacterium]|nr:tRNA (guanosine(18)-2'-O)-methyltransferase [Chlamydiia bacterium]